LFEAIFSFFLSLLSDDVNVYQVVYECFNFRIVIMDAVELSIVVHNCIDEKLAYGEEAGSASQTLGSVAAMEADCLVQYDEELLCDSLVLEAWLVGILDKLSYLFVKHGWRQI
jgi:hypothetical protein